jgi:hypothetical protein
MLLGHIDHYEIHIWKFNPDHGPNGEYQDATEKEVAQPNFNPIIVFRPKWGQITATPIVYENEALYFVYTDVITDLQVKERVELMGGGYNRLLTEAEEALKKYFQR